MQKQAPYALGIDIGGTNTKLGLIDRRGNLIAFLHFPTDAAGTDPHPFLTRLEENMDKLLVQAPGLLAGIGISTHGYIDEGRHGPIACLSTPALRGIDLSSWAGERYHLPVRLNNDLIAHALAEYTYGSGRGSRRFMCLAVGTGLGVGVIINGEPLRYVGGTTGDGGRLILERGGIKCKYGVGGSAEALCGVANIERLAEQRYKRRVPAHEVISAAREGSDPTAVQIIRQIGEHLGLVLANLYFIFLPEKIALTGGTAEAGAVLLEAVRQHFYELAGEYSHILQELTIGYYGAVEIVLGEKPNESGLLGAVVEVFQN